MHIGRFWKGDSEEQFQWEVSLWEKVFPRADTLEEATARRSTSLGPEGREEEVGRIAQEPETDRSPEEQRAAAAVGLTRKPPTRPEEAHIPAPHILIIDEPDQEATAAAHIP
eukprot:4641880-Heterocapsa_arctica.AAC.1